MCRPLTLSEGSLALGYYDQPTGDRSAQGPSGQKQKEKTMIFHTSRATYKAIGRLERQIKKLAPPDRRVEVLQRTTGLGLLTAMALVSEIGDISRFPDACKLCAGASLTPKVRNSDLGVHHHEATRQDPVAVRWLLVEAAQTAKRNPRFDDRYDSIRRRLGRQIATVSIARRLLAPSFHLLREVGNIAAAEADRRAG
jgi:transposase